MKLNTYKLYYKTQSKTFLLLMMLTIIALGLIISTIVNYSKQEIIETKSTIQNLNQLSLNELSTESYKKELDLALTNPKIDLEELVNFMEALAIVPKQKATEITIDELNKNKDISPHYATFALFLKVQNNLANLEELIELSQKNEKIKYANRLLSHHYFHIQDLKKAAECLKAEATLLESETCKNRYVSLLIQLKNIAELEILERDENYKSQNDDISKFLLVEKKSWQLLFKVILKSQFDISYNGIFFLTLLTGLVWFSIWLHALRPIKFFSALLLSLGAFGLGVFSTSLTIFTIYIEEDIFHMHQGESLVQGILYFILGVGLREEFTKALVFLVLIPILIKRKNALEWLIIPGMVGLGFATEENLNYFLADPTHLAGRFLTANFMHVAQTAIIGESLCYYFYDRTKGPEHLLSTFSMIVMIHGAYDAFIVVKDLESLKFITSFIFIYTTFLFFGRLKTLRSSALEPISLSTHFIFGLSILFMSAFIYFSYDSGHFHAFKLLAPSILDLAIFIYMFLYLMPNSIIKL